ncbi:MAG: DUF2442 domain-containing protein [Kiritimatiellia bacterium]|jgi:hypothetical protein
MNPRVKNVAVTDDYKLKLEFANGETGVFDCSPLLDLDVFKELRDKNYFRQARAEYGTVTWPHEQDVCPDTLYMDSKRNTMRQQEPWSIRSK